MSRVSLRKRIDLILSGLAVTGYVIIGGGLIVSVVSSNIKGRFDAAPLLVSAVGLVIYVIGATAWLLNTKPEDFPDDEDDDKILTPARCFLTYRVGPTHPPGPAQSLFYTTPNFVKLSLCFQLAIPMNRGGGRWLITL